MGFRRRLPEESIAADFHSVHVYEAQGFTIEHDMVLEGGGVVAASPYKLALASSVNAAARKLLSDDLTDDEDSWVAEHKCTPPFVLIHIGPTARHSMSGDFLKVEKSSITTYEGFLPARTELRKLENSILPSVISALTCAFSTFENPVRFLKITRDVFGITPQGQVVHDFGIQVRAEVYVAKRMGSDDAAAFLERANSLAATISPKVSRFFQLALEEDDPLKKFLWFFLTIERQTHAAFTSMDHPSHMASILRSPDRVHAASVEFFGGQLERWTTLSDRFVWCAISVWTHLGDADVAAFRRLKKVRDQIAHGELASPPADAVAEIEKLAAKLQIGPDDADA